MREGAMTPLQAFRTWLLVAKLPPITADWLICLFHEHGRLAAQRKEKQ